MTANGKKQTLSKTQSEERDPRALKRPDWIVLALLALTLVIAPIAAGRFATPPDMSLLPPSEPLEWLQAVGIPLMAVLTAVALLISIWREWQRPVAIGGVPFLTGASLLTAGWAALSLLRSPALYTGLNAMMALIMVLAWAGMVARLSRDRDALTVLFAALIVAGALGAALGLQEFAGKWREGDTLHRTFGAFLNPDFLAGYLLLPLPVTAAAFTGARERLPRVALGTALLLQTMCLLLTGSRTGLVALAVGLLLWAALSVWSGAVQGRWKQLGLALALVVVGAALASAPTRARLLTSPAPPPAAKAPVSASGQGVGSGASAAAPATTTQSQSLKFRSYTWQGTVALIKANPLLGTGLGSYELAYPRYAITAYTAHAHNSLLQWTSDTGLPGALFLLTALAAATAFGFNVLRLRRAALSETENEETAAGTTTEAGDALSSEPALLLAALLGALVASAIKTFLDSDWFIVGTGLTLCAVVVLLVGLARDIAPLAAQTPRPLSRSFLAACVLPALFLLWRGGGVFLAHIDVAQGAQALQDQRPQEALDDFRQAADADPYDPTLHLTLAELYGGMQRPDEQRKEIQTAIRVAPVAKAYYRLGQLEDRLNQPVQAAAAYQKARSLDPHNLQTLHRLADALSKAGRVDEAVAVYGAMTNLETAPYGTVRAMADEMIETEFAYAHFGLASIAADRRQFAEAVKENKAAAQVLRAYWNRRNWLAYQNLAPGKRAALAKLYLDVLAAKLAALKAENAPAAEADQTATEQGQVTADLQKDQEAQKAASGSGPNS